MAVRPLPSPNTPEFLEFLAAWTGAPYLPGHSLSELANGDRFFPAVNEAIRSARHEVLLETYMFWSGAAGEACIDALCDRARAGVTVRVLIDWMGARGLTGADRRRMLDAGVDLHFFHPGVLQWCWHLNHRTHRKQIIVDRRIGFTGGAGFEDNWLGDAGHSREWRDSLYEIHGPIVPAMAEAFDRLWLRIKPDAEPASVPLEIAGPAGEAWMQVVEDAGDDDRDPIYEVLLLSMRCARRSIRVGMAYFVPSHDMVDAMVAARRRGVSVEILIPGKYIDSWIVKPASRPLWGPLLRSGVRIFRYQPTMYHPKIIIVDDVWVSIGSCNWDNRSLRLQEELNLNVWSAPFARTQIDQFELDKLSATEVTLQAWKRRGLGHRIVEGLVWPLKPLL
jgi:cardiolipin synthase